MLSPAKCWLEGKLDRGYYTVLAVRGIAPWGGGDNR
jgi:hypothetical protein